MWYNIKKDGADHEVPRNKTSSFIHPFACQNRFDASFSAVAVLVCSTNQLGGLVYHYISEFKWNDVAGSLFENQSNYAEAEQEYFVDTLGYTEEEYIVLRSAVQEQYSNTNNSVLLQKRKEKKRIDKPM
ncbi:MAG: hypothetical protein IKC63_04940 [Clostridia bacterium]|nr:hypothetical protein [Clostridia bacterium]